MNFFPSRNSPEDASRVGKISPLRTDATAWGASLGLHTVLLVALAAMTLALPQVREELDLAYLAEELPEEELLPQEFFSADEPLEDIGALSQAGDESARASAMVIEEQSLVRFDPELLADYGELLTVDVESPVFSGPELTDEISVQGIGSQGVSGAVGAIDRITHEILTSVEQQRTLVVWLFDQSGSLRKEREQILARFERIYTELGVIEAAENPAFKKHHDKPLLTAVVGFGKNPQMLTTEPTDRIEEIEAAAASIADDDTGQENVFRAIRMTAEKFRSYRLERQDRRNVMIVVFTDEAGDDVSRSDATVDLCRKLGMPVYVVGRPAPFGREKAYVKWIDPDPNFDQRPQWVPVTLGPETLMPERLKLHFAGSRGRDDLLDSGYGPYALTRLCYETGGLYFAAHPNRAVGKFVSGRDTSNLASHFTAFFDPETMRRYQPDYITLKEYQDRLQANRACRSLIEAARLSWTSPLEEIRRRFPKRDDASLAASLSVAQRAAAIRQPQLDRLYQILLAGEEDRENIKSPRWQAGYDLALGRALAAKVRNDGYNAILARAKLGLEFQNPENNTWVLASDQTFANSHLEKLAGQAEEHLRRVLSDHPATPWALLAEQELDSPFGWSWDEDYTFIPPPQVSNNNAPSPNRPQPQRPTRPPRRNPPPL